MTMYKVWDNKYSIPTTHLLTSSYGNAIDYASDRSKRSDITLFISENRFLFLFWKKVNALKAGKILDCTCAHDCPRHSRTQ